MKLRVKAHDEEGNVVVDGHFNRNEITFLLNYAVQDLLNAGVQYHLEEPYDEEADEEDDDSLIRFEFPKQELN